MRRLFPTPVLAMIRIQARALWADKLTFFTLLASGLFAWFGTFEIETELHGLPAAVALAIAPALGLTVRGRGIDPAHGSVIIGAAAPALPATRTQRTLASALLLAFFLGVSAVLWGLTGLAWGGGGHARGLAGVVSGLALMVGGGAFGASSSWHTSERNAGLSSLAVPIILGATGALGSVAVQLAVAAAYLSAALWLPDVRRTHAVAPATPLGATSRPATAALLRLHPLQTPLQLLAAALAVRLIIPFAPEQWRETLAACIVMGLILGALFLPQLPLPARPDPSELAGTATLRWLPVRPRHAWLQLLLCRVLLVQAAFLLSSALLLGPGGVVFTSNVQVLRGLVVLPAAAACVSIAGPLQPLAPSRALRVAGIAGMCLAMFGAVWVWGPNAAQDTTQWFAAAALVYAATVAFLTWRRLPGTLLA